MNAAKNGVLFEALVHISLCRIGCIERNGKNVKALNVVDIEKYSKLVKKLENTFKSSPFYLTSSDSFQFIHDHDGKKGISSDVTFFIKGKRIGISLKKDNSSLKAQRPGALYKQMGVDESINSMEYKNTYKSIINMIYDSFIKDLKDKEHVFNQVDTKLRLNSMYRINELYYQHLSTSSIDEKYEFLKFIIGDSDYMIKWNSKKDLLQIYNIQTVFQDKSIENITMRDNYIYIYITNGMKLSLRLHTAMSKITKNLSFKYDTILENYNSVILSEDLAF
jgi:hypothetical protein